MLKKLTKTKIKRRKRYEENRKRDEEERKRRTRNIVICSVLGGMVIGLAIWNRSRRSK